MSTLRLLAIEDELIYAESLRLIIEELGYILIDVTDDIGEFQRLVKATIPDVLLIDIDLGAAKDGIQLADEVSAYSSAPVIFITASKDLQTINRAKDARPSAYIPKPYEPSTLQAAIELATMKSTISELPKYGSNEESFFIKSEGVLKKVKVKDLLYIEVKEKFCHLTMVSGRLEVKMRLKDLIEQLPSNQIIQIHRSFAVMKDYIEEVDTVFSSMKVSGVLLPIGKNYKESLIGFLRRID